MAKETRRQLEMRVKRMIGDKVSADVFKFTCDSLYKYYEVCDLPSIEPNAQGANKVSAAHQIMMTERNFLLKQWPKLMALETGTPTDEASEMAKALIAKQNPGGK